MKLNLGAGPNHLPIEQGWTNTDLRADHGFEVEQQWDFLKPIPLPDNSVDFILAWHILEHAGLHERDGMIKDWYRVLKPGGKLAIAVPDILVLLGMYQREEFSSDPGPWYILMVNIFGPYNGFEGDIHKWGYCFDELAHIVRESGFGKVDRLNHGNIPIEILKHTKGNPPKVVFADWAAQIIAVK